MADAHDITDDIKWLTYDELATARGISKASATRLVFRRAWRRQTGNDGMARVAVPMVALNQPPDVAPAMTGGPRPVDTHDATHDGGGALERVIELLNRQIDRGQEQAIALAEARQAQSRLQLDLVAACDLVAQKTAEAVELVEERQRVADLRVDLVGARNLLTVKTAELAQAELARMMAEGLRQAATNAVDAIEVERREIAEENDRLREALQTAEGMTKRHPPHGVIARLLRWGRPQ